MQPVNAVQARLLTSLTSSGRVPATLTTTAASVIRVRQVEDAQLDAQFAGLPSQLPDPASAPEQSGGVCAAYGESRTTTAFTVPERGLPDHPPGSVVETMTSRRGIADTVRVGPGHAAIVRSGDGAPAVFLVAGSGTKFAFADRSVLTAFGYAGVTATTLPGELCALLPTGPALDPQAARRPVPG